MTASQYVEGSGLAVVGAQMGVLLPGGDVATARAVQARVAAGGGPSQVLQAITVGSPLGLGELPDFAVVAWQPDAVQVFVRGPLAVVVEADGGPTRVDGADVVTWREQTVRGALRCEIGPADGWADNGLPLTDGTVRAAGLAMARLAGDLVPVEHSDGGSSATAADAGAPGHRAPEVIAEPAAEPLVTPIAEPAAEPLVTPIAEPAVDALVTPIAGSPEPVAPLISDVPDLTLDGLSLVDGGFLTQAEAETRLPDDETPPTPPSPHDVGYDHLWGATQMRSVEEAAVRGVDEDGGLDLARGVADIVHDGETIGPTALAALRAARGDRGPLPPGPPPGHGAPVSHGVLARMCLSGHTNPPERTECWVCGRSVEGDAARCSRPPLGRVRLATGEVVELDASYVVGRRPKANRVSGEVPRVLAVQSPEGEVSASHLAIRLEEWHVLAVDQSRNGTVLFREGDDPRRLQPEVPMIMRSGDVLDLGDGAVLTFEGLP